MQRQRQTSDTLFYHFLPYFFETGDTGSLIESAATLVASKPHKSPCLWSPGQPSRALELQVYGTTPGFYMDLHRSLHTSFTHWAISLAPYNFLKIYHPSIFDTGFLCVSLAVLKLTVDWPRTHRDRPTLMLSQTCCPDFCVASVLKLQVDFDRLDFVLMWPHPPVFSLWFLCLEVVTESSSSTLSIFTYASSTASCDFIFKLIH